jgi:tetratricopeptide (TPR) repeat protein
MADIFELQEALARDIAKRVVPYVRQLELQRARSKRPENLTAYERTLRAINHFHRSSHEDLDQARALLEAAIESDPSYVTPYAWLAHLYVRRVGQGWSDDTKRDTVEARRYAEAALDRDDTDPLALTVSGLVSGYLDKDLKTAIAHYDRALAINPSASSAWIWSTSTYAWLGQGEEAIRRSQRAMELSPLDPLMYTFTSIAGTAHAVAGQYDKAIEFCRRSLRLNRMFASTHRILAISLALSGDMEAARQAAAELLRLEPGLTVGGFRTRYPGNASEHADQFCEALAMAGVPR